jgi:formate dehydrogenase subunit delta
MSHESPHAKLIYMANQIAKFMESKPHDQGVAELSSHINDFWEPRMRRHLFEVLDAGGKGLRPLVLDAAANIRRPAEAA